jgi:hypothetical protein
MELLSFRGMKSRGAFYRKKEFISRVYSELDCFFLLDVWDQSIKKCMYCEKMFIFICEKSLPRS